MDSVDDRHNGSDASSSGDTVNVEVTNYEKTQLGQAPLPLAPAPAPAVPINEKEQKSKDKKKQKSKDKKNKKSKDEKKDKDSDDEGEDPFAHLPEHEKAVLKRQLDIPAVKVTYFMLFRYATTNDKILIVISAVASIIGGALLPLMTIVFGGLTTTFKDFFQHETTKAHFNHELSRFSLYFLYLAIGEFV
ncbi:hypothetical protein KCU98_g18705, partial [Aureobasidium melanogenum]